MPRPISPGDPVRVTGGMHRDRAGIVHRLTTSVGGETVLIVESSRPGAPAEAPAELLVVERRHAARTRRTATARP